uniref:Uncharacterized protein n=1 Tax=Pristionchus pacificus TaxID=54126 RepID=A0A2A6CVZ7_PRIPA
IHQPQRGDSNDINDCDAIEEPSQQGNDANLDAIRYVWPIPERAALEPLQA